MFFVARICAQTIAILALTAAAAAQEATLIFGTGSAPTSPTNIAVNHTWARRINDAGKGVIRIDVRDGMALVNANNSFNRVMDDVVQIANLSLSYVGGRFPLSEVINLPLISDKSETASVAFWRLYKSGALDSEFKDVVPLFVVAYPQAVLHLTKPASPLNDLRGLKIQSGGKVLSDTISRLGGTPISLTVVDLYEALQRGTVNGTVIQYMTFPIFKFDEVTSHHVEFPFSSWPQIVFMTRKQYDALSPAARRILDENSGEQQSRVWGAFLDQLETSSRASIMAKPARHTIAAPAQLAQWREKIQPVIEDWVKSTPGADKVLAAYRAELEKAKN